VCVYMCVCFYVLCFKPPYRLESHEVSSCEKQAKKDDWSYSDSLRAGRSGYQIAVGARFLQPARPVLEPTQIPIQWVPGLSRG